MNVIEAPAVRLCACGCGQATSIAKQTDPRKGHLKGQPVRFIRGHVCHPHRPPAERLWAKVDQSAGPEACWPFMGARTTDGYGQIKVAGRPVRAHRLAWELAHPRIPIPPSARLTTADVLEIRRLHDQQGFGVSLLALRFRVSRPAVYDILAGRNWGWLQESA